MAIYPRKLLLPEINDGKKPAPPCLICYTCDADDCRDPPPNLSPPSDSQKHQMSSILIIMLGVLGVVFLILSYLTIYSFRKRVRNARNRNLEGPGPVGSTEDFLDNQGLPAVDHHIWYIRTSGLPQSAIDSISIFQFKNGESPIDGSDCIVCLNEFKEDETLRLMPKCNHAFHLSCIDTWLQSHKNCPVCRSPILITDRTGQVQSSEQINLDPNDRLLSSVSLEHRGLQRETTTGPIQDDTFPELNQELQAMRRSISMDSSYASLIYDKMVKEEGFVWGNKFGRRLCKNSIMYRMIRNNSSSSTSNVSFLQKGPILMKRSFSCSGKRVVRKKHNSASHELHM